MRPARVLLVVFALSLASTPAFAAKELGLLAGFNFATLNIDGVSDMDPRSAFMAGGVGDFGINDRFGIRVEAAFTSNGGKSTHRNAYWGTNDGADFQLDCINIPVMARYDLSDTPTHAYLLGGIGTSFATDYKVELTQGNDKATADLGDVFSTIDVSLDLGAGLSYKIGANRLTVDARAAIGLMNINDGGTIDVNGTPLTIPDNSTKTMDFRLVASYFFPIK